MSLDALFKMTLYDDLCVEVAYEMARPFVDPNLSFDDMLQEARIAVMENELYPSLRSESAEYQDLGRSARDLYLQRNLIRWRLRDYTRTVLRQRRGQTGWDEQHELHH